MRVLVANDPRVYREVIADALKRLRPLIEVSAAEPGELDREVGRLRPHLVICSRISAAVERAGCLLAWAVLYPDGEDRVEIGGNGGGPTALLDGVGVDDLLSVVDETQLLCGSSREDENGSARTYGSSSGIGRAGSELPGRVS